MADRSSARRLRAVFAERLGRPGFAGGGRVSKQKPGLGWQTPSPEPDDYIKSLTHSLPHPSWSDTKGFAKSLLRDPMRLTEKYGLGYAPLDVVRDVAGIMPGEGKAVAYSIDSMGDATAKEAGEFKRAGYNPLQYGLNAVDRVGNAVSRGIEQVPGAIRAARDYLSNVSEDAHDVAGYAGGGRVTQFIKNLRSTMGASQAARAEKAADLTDLSRLSDQGLLELFHPANPTPILAMKPGDFQKFAMPLPEDYKQEVPYGRFHNQSARMAARPGRSLDLSHYLDLMGSHLSARGMDEPPLLWTYKNLDNTTQIEGHQGRHRMMAMDKLGDPLSLVKTLPAREGEGFMMDPDERVQFLMDKYFPLGSMTPVAPEIGGAPRPIQSQAFADGGSVVKRAMRGLSEFASKVREIAGPDSGFTWHPITGETPTKGFAASIFPDRGEVLEPGHVGVRRLMKYAERNRDLLNDSTNFLGAWNDPASGKIYLDVSKVSPNEIELSQAARKANQKAYFDLDNLRSLPLDENSLYADGGEVKPPVLGAGIQWIKKLDELFGPASKRAAADVRRNAEQRGTEALSYGHAGTHLDDLPFVLGAQHMVPVDQDTSSRILSLPHMNKFFTVHSHPFITPDILGEPQIGARLAQQGIPGTPHPSIGDLRMLQHLNPSRHTMMIEAAGRPDLRVALGRGEDDPNSIYSGIGYLSGRNPGFLIGEGADRTTALSDKIRAANKQFGMHPYDNSALSGLFNEGLARRGMNVMMDPAGTASNGASLMDLLPEYTKFLGSDLPESWKARGGRVPGYAGGSRVTKLAEDAISRLKALRAEKGFDPKKPEYLPPDPKLQRGIVNDPVRLAYPGIYKSPRDIAQEAADIAQHSAPDLGKESNLYKVFGVTRGDLYDIMRDSDRRMPTDIPPRPAPPSARNAVAPQVLTDKNMQHQLDVLHETMGHSHLFTPSAAWYTMDPVWDRMEQRGLPLSDQVRTNNVTAMHSPSSSPYDEFSRGLAALNFAKRGRLDDYVKYGSGSKPIRALPDYPTDMFDVPGHVAHDAHKMMLQKFLANENAPWSELTDAVKVPHYAAASDPRGAFLDNFVGDSHIARGLGFPDARTSTTHGVIASNLSGPEYWSTLPWYQKLAQKAGMKATPLQATQWNAFGPQTGVETVGKPKAEILADLISNRANKAGISIEQATDEILSNDRYKRGGKVNDDFGLYHNMFFKHGGRVGEDFELYHAGPWE